MLPVESAAGGRRHVRVSQLSKITKISVSTGVFWIEVQEADVRILCGSPADAVKHLLRRGLIVPIEVDGVHCESGPNAILLSDLAIQNGQICSRAEFPILQMLYNQGMILPNHPRNTGSRPMLIGSRSQVDAQMAYIFRGNYGLASVEELTAADLTRGEAEEVMRMKLAFAFGRIQSTDELVTPVYVEHQAVEVRNGVRVRRLRTNVFEIAYGSDHVEVDLNLPPGEDYPCPYSLDNHLLEREYFAVVHTGDGDGWDMNRPTMGSIILFQGRVYLVDAGPNIGYALNALGIGVNEVDGIFHTHCHDDHLVGLHTLTRGDRRIAYYAVPMVRDSVIRKLAALLDMREGEFGQLFDVRDLRLDEWNDVEGLEVKPILSPHPVETTILYFRVLWEGGYRTYGHLADIASVDVMRKMIAPDDAPHGISQARFESTVRAYLEKADIKKIDIGGGLIHGAAADFRDDASGKLILAHTSRALTPDERAIGSGAPFGTVDVLIRGVTEALRRRAFSYLRDYFPDVPRHRIRHLMNCSIEVFNPQVLLMRRGEAIESLYIILSGAVEMLRPGTSGSSVLSAGSIVGETAILLGVNATETYRAMSFVQAMRVPHDIYRDFIVRNALYREVLQTNDKREFLRGSELFGDGVSCVTLKRLVQAAEPIAFENGELVDSPHGQLVILRSGSGELLTGGGHRERLVAGSHFGAAGLAGDGDRHDRVRFLEAATGYDLPLELLAAVPVVKWKLIESQRRRHVTA